MISKKEVRAFINPYLKNNLTNVSCITETITRYVEYDKEMVELNKEKIHEFILTNFNIDSICIYLERLIEDKNVQEWNNIKSFDDLELLEELLGLGIVSGLFEDDLRMRLQVIGKAGVYSKLFNPELMDLSTEFQKKAYFASMRNMILPIMFFKVNEESYKKYNNNSREFTQEEKKYILGFWFKEMNSLHVSDKDYNKFISLVEEKTDVILDIAVMLRLMRQSSEAFLINMQFDPKMVFIDSLLSQISSFTPEQRDYFEEVKRVFLCDIEKMKKRYDDNDDMKKTLR